MELFKKIGLAALLITSGAAHGGSPGVVLAGVSFESNADKAAGWTNEAWQLLPEINPDQLSIATSISIANDHVYIGGYSRDYQSVEQAGYWLDGDWTTLTANDNNFGAETNTIKVANGHIYVGGFAISVGEYPNDHPVPGIWIDGMWSRLPSVGAGLNSAEVSAIDVDSDGHVYAGGFAVTGYVNPWNPGVTNAGYWLDGTWNQLPAVGVSQNAEVTGLVVNGGHVYAAGFSTNGVLDSDGHQIIVPGYWLDGSWTALPQSNANCSGRVNAIAVTNSHVYIVGADCGAAAYWLDGVETLLAPQGSVNAIFVTNDSHVYLGGGTSTEGPGYWVDGAFVSAASTVNKSVYAIGVLSAIK